VLALPPSRARIHARARARGQRSFAGRDMRLWLGVA